MIAAAKVSVLLICIANADVINIGQRLRNLPKVPSDDRFNFFDYELIQEISKVKEGNVLVSPVSVKAALFMALEGSKGQTAEEIKDVLRLPEETEYYRKRAQLFIQSLKMKAPATTVEMANSFFVSQDIRPYEDYIDALRKYYHADTKEVNFNLPKITATTINNWVNGVTHGFIPKLVDSEGLPPDSRLMLANAVYFKGKWKIAFDIDVTTERCFYKENLQCQKSNFMETLSYFKYGYISRLDAEAVEILYTGEKFSMVIMLPRKRTGINKLIRDLQHSPLTETIENLQLTELFLSIPRFSISFSTELVPTLKKLGIHDLFGPNANLSGVASNIGSSYINKVLHATKIEVNEEGTIAGAGTGVLVVPLMGTTIPRFRADSPFLFFVRDVGTGSILFGGRVSTPEEAGSPIKSPVLASSFTNLDSRKEETTEHFRASPLGFPALGIPRIPTYPLSGRPTIQQPQPNDKDFSFPDTS